MIDCFDYHQLLQPCQQKGSIFLFIYLFWHFVIPMMVEVSAKDRNQKVQNTYVLALFWAVLILLK